MRVYSLVWVLCLATLMTACGGGHSNSSSSNDSPSSAPSTIGVTVSPSTASVEVGTTQQFTASVTNTTNSAVSWQVNGTTGGNSTSGTISATGLYTAPATVPNPAQVTVSAVSQADTSKSASATITVQPHFSAQTLQGQYVFQMGGYDGTTSFRASGVFTADGNGKLTGIEDLVEGPTVLPALAFTGSYTVNQDGTGTATIVTSGDTTTLAFVMEGDKRTGDFIEYDSNANASGYFTRQDSSAFSNAGISGTYIFTIGGTENGFGPAHVLGSLIADGKGSLSGTEDLNEQGVYAPGISFTGTYSVQANGRGIASVTNVGGTSSFFIYVIDASRVVFMESDGTTDFTGAARRQQGAFSNASLNGSYVLVMSGPTIQSYVSSVGRFIANGSGIISGTLDSVDGVTPMPNQPLNGTYSVGSNGRGTATITTSSGTSNVVFWMIDSTRIYAMSTDSDSVEDAVVRQQSGGPYSVASVSGAYAFAAGGVSNTGLLDTLGRLVVDGQGGLQLSEKINDTRTPSQFSTTGTYVLDSSGRGVATLNGISAPLVFYMISPAEAYVQQMDATTTSGVAVKQF